MKIQVNKFLCCLLFVLTCLFSVLINTNIGINSAYAFSSTNEYSNVLDDLTKDNNFKKSDYQKDVSDYSLNVIQIAESVNNELFVYVYQPCSPNIDLQATTINISKGIDENLSYENYKLKLVNFSGVFYKYKVDNFEIETAETRFYDISSIFRKWKAIYDGVQQNDNTISEVAFAVGKQYVVQSENGNVTYNCLQTETVLITSKFVDSFRYWYGWYVVGSEKIDRHFVAFSTDYAIDKLYEVDLIFTTKHYTTTQVEVLPFDLLAWQVAKTYESPVEHNVTLKYTQKSNLPAQGIFGRSYSWDRIESATNFLASNTEIAQSTKDNVSTKQYVLSFYETTWAKATISGISCVNGTEVYDLSLLRLKFEVNGVVYNLGVVDNKQSSDNVASNYNQGLIFINDIKLILGLILLVLLFVVLAPILPQIISFIVWLIKGLWQIITAPFKALKMSKKKRKKGGDKK